MVLLRRTHMITIFGLCDINGVLFMLHTNSVYFVLYGLSTPQPHMCHGYHPTSELLYITFCKRTKHFVRNTYTTSLESSPNTTPCPVVSTFTFARSFHFTPNGGLAGKDENEWNYHNRPSSVFTFTFYHGNKLKSRWLEMGSKTGLLKIENRTI